MSATDDRRKEIIEKIMMLDAKIKSDKILLSSNASDIGDWKIIKTQEYIIAGKPSPYDIDELNIARDKVRKEINDYTKEYEELIKELDSLTPNEEEDNTDDIGEVESDDDEVITKEEVVEE